MMFGPIGKVVDEKKLRDQLLGSYSTIKARISKLTHGVSIFKKDYEKWYLPLVVHYVNERDSKGISSYIVGLSGGVGAGKSILSVILRVSLEFLGFKVLAFSIDDYYKNPKERDKWRRNHAGNPFYKYRGLFGMHQVKELRHVLSDLILGKNETILHFDKGLLGGKGDTDWKRDIDTRMDFVIFDGWCIGMPSFTVDEFMEGINSTAYGKSVWKKLGASRNDLLTVLHELDLYQAIWDHCDSNLLLLAKNVRWIEEWRLEQEHRLIKHEGKGMTDLQVKGFVFSFIPFILQFYHMISEKEEGDIFDIVLRLSKVHLPVKVDFYSSEIN